MAHNNYYFNGYDNNSYNYYGPYKQNSTSGNVPSFGEKMQTAMNNDGEVLKFTPAVGSGKPTMATTTKPMNFDPATPGTKGNANTNAPSGKGSLSDVNAPANLGEKNVPVNTTKPVGSQPVQSKPSITGKPVQVFDYNDTAPGNKGNLNTVSPTQGKQVTTPTFDNKPAQQPTYQNNQRPNNVEPANPGNSRPQQVQPNYNERPQQVQPNNNNRPQQSQPTYERPRDNISQPQQQQRPQQNYQSQPQRNQSRPQSTSPRSDNNDRPQYNAPSNNGGGGNRGNMGSSPSNNGGNRGNMGSSPSNSGGGRNGSRSPR
ncbi:MAG: hypothetical protein M0D57_20930 [Sphingobacteriales bacterium JAD_PAG50586_3]|nr:MAG: hypothetical protein M0D57_20930 [Sphingobacteriales bacterium JAD_PAG50586_3]